MMPRRKSLKSSYEEIQKFLFCDKSDTEDLLINNNEEDIYVIETNTAALEASSDNEDVDVVRDSGCDSMMSKCRVVSSRKLKNPSTPDASSVQVSSTVPIRRSRRGRIEKKMSEPLLFSSSKLKNPSTPGACNISQKSNVPVMSNLSTWKWKQVTKERKTNQSYCLSDNYQFGKVLIDTKADPSPYEVFEKVANFDKFLSDIVIPQSTLYCHQNGKVFSTTLEEMKAFFGMELVMGYHVLPCLRDYWSSDPDLCVPFIANVMSRTRFEEIRSSLHFNDNKLMRRPSDPLHDRAFKIRPVINHFNESFSNAMAPCKFQLIDEHMIKYKGRSTLKQYVKKGPIKWGFKMWCRCAAKSGYLFECNLYTGREIDSTEHDLGTSVVLQLTEKIQGIGCHVYFDDFFNSPSLQLQLSQRGILSAGTVNPDCKNLPTAGVPFNGAMRRGEVSCFESNGVFFVKWMDNQPVHMLSNYLSAFPTTAVLCIKSEGSSVEVLSRYPKVVAEYNEVMRTIDIMNQKKVTFQFDRKTSYKYYLRVVSDLFDIAVNNAYVVYCSLAEIDSSNMESLDSKAFRRIIARRLIGYYSNRKRSVPTTTIVQNHKKFKLSITLTQAAHTMKKTDGRRRCRFCSSNKIEKRTDNLCVECGIHLCYVKTRNCFETYHQEMMSG